jgi:2-oxoglutarate ferredoxin oxidoreductase subunit delta
MNQVEEGPQAPGVAVDAPTVRKKRPRGRVHVFDNWCKGCGICIEFCPQQVFDMDEDGRPIVAHPEECKACQWCEIHCPDLAITVTKLEETDAGKTASGE